MEKKREVTKNLLADKFKDLVKRTGFDKITIKQITDATGVIRPTFYNYFQDKYEVMEWLLERDIFGEARKLMEDGNEKEAISLIFQRIDQDRIYYQKAFEVSGQNGFEEILGREFKKLIGVLLTNHRFRPEKYPGLQSVAVFTEFQAVTIVSGMKLWVTHKGRQLNADEAMDFYFYLMSHSIIDIINT